MTPEQIRVALAEALGAKWYEGKCGWYWFVLGDPKKYVSSECPIVDRPSGSASVSYCCPDYPGDEKAAKDATVKLCDSEKKMSDFNYWLHQSCGLKVARDLGSLTHTEFANNTASALDICTATLKAIGKWKEEA